MATVKIKTLTMGVSGMLCVHFTEGPVVELNEDDVLFVESTCDRWVSDEDLTAYIYRKYNKYTLAVRYCELLKVSPDLAKKAKDSMIYKSKQPDPLCGSCS